MVIWGTRFPNKKLLNNPPQVLPPYMGYRLRSYVNFEVKEEEEKKKTGRETLKSKWLFVAHGGFQYESYLIDPPSKYSIDFYR